MLSLPQRALPAGNDASGTPADRPALFIDKDGTLVENVPYNVDPAQLRFARGALEALAAVAAAGYALVVVTNQAGVALGRFTRGQLDHLEKVLHERLWHEAGVRLEGFHACLHAPCADGRPACLCRKPAPGLLQQAAVTHRLDLSCSWMVGDILDDVEAGRRAGVRSVLLDVGNETVWSRSSPWREPHHVCTTWSQVAQVILASKPVPAAPRPRPPQPATAR